jgi:cytochrome b pre-mRNA-processing protein 3
MILQRLFGRKKPDPCDALYATIVAAARQPKFYAEWQVPDTLDGRFDIMILHVFLVIERLRALGEGASTLSQALTDRFFAEMDSALREVGVGDLVVGKKVRKMAEAYIGRAKAYTAALSKGESELAEALSRNVYAGVQASNAPQLARWSLQARSVLANYSLQQFKTGQVRFEP